MDEPYKVFDVSRPQPSRTSRPVIVGHQPEMTDPMVRRPLNPIRQTSEPQLPPAAEPLKVPINDNPPVHQAKNIEVTDEIRQAIAEAHSPKVDVSILSQPAPLVDSSAPAIISPAGSMASAPPTAAQMPTPPAPPEPSSPTPQMPPVEAPPEPPVEPSPDLQAQSLPVSPLPVARPKRLGRVLVWLAVIIILAVVAAYLLIDAGIIRSSINLPFHIFGQ